MGTTMVPRCGERDDPWFEALPSDDVTEIVRGESPDQVGELLHFVHECDGCVAFVARERNTFVTMRRILPGLIGLVCALGVVASLVTPTMSSSAAASPADLSSTIVATPVPAARTEPESGPQLTAAVWRMAIGQAVIDAGETKLGSPYVYSASGPNAFDCSGFTRWAWMQMGVTLPHNSGAQWDAVDRIDLDELLPGDIVFDWGPGESSPGHVGLYVGDGMMIHAPNGGGVVRYDPLTWWTGATVAAGRVR